MNLKYKPILFLCIIVFIAILTNPNQESHREKVKMIFKNFYQKSLEENSLDEDGGLAVLGNFLGTSLINTLVDSAISSDNYVLFSLTKLTFEGEETVIGFGIFGNVFLSDKIEDSFTKKLQND
jgi:hypothetical protein